ncbi:MAG: AI-2E family transporter, partial [Lachnospiraceae bacterium]|nr:AI-2E family transporter [Lachnospiraceae bacterium]
MEEKKDKEYSSGVHDVMTHATPPGKNQRFIRNDQYFTVCVYTFILVVFCAIAIKAIVSFSETQAFVGGMFRAIAPFLIALLIAYILTPFVRALQRFFHKQCHMKSEKLSMILAMVIVYVLGLGMIIMVLIYVLPEIVRNLIDLVNYIPAGYDELMGFLEQMQERFPNVDFSSFISMLQNTQSELTSGLRSIAADLIPVLYTASVSVVQWLANFLIAVIVSVYMLYGQASLKRMLRIVFYAFVPKKRIDGMKEVLLECNSIFSKYVVSKMIDSLIIGILCAILMSILRMPYILLISAVVGVTNMIPYFGPFIGAVPGIVIILVIDPVKALIFAFMILCLQQFDGLFLGPKLMGSSTGMKPIWIIFAIT